MALRYWVGGTASWDTTPGTKWALTSGGAGGQAVPTSSDDVFMDAASGAVVVTVITTANCKSLTHTGFTGTFAGTSTINLFGSLTLSATATYTNTGTLIANATGTYTSNGKEWGGGLTPSTGSFITTLADPFVVNGVYNHAGSGGTQTYNGSTLTIKGNFTMTNGRVVTGTSQIIFGGTSGTSTINSSGTCGSAIIFNSTNAIILITWNFAVGGSFTHIASSSFTATGTVGLFVGTVVLDMGSASLNIISMASSSGIVSLTSTLNFNTLTSTQVGTLTFSGAFGFNVGTLSIATGDIILTSGNTYNVLTSFVTTGASTAGVNATVQASASPTKAFLNVAQSATMDVGFCSPTDIDSSGGKQIQTFRGTITNSTNWVQLPTQPPMIVA